MKRLLRIFKSAVGQGMIPPPVHDTLKCVELLKRGRTSAPEAKAITPVDAMLVNATLPFLTKVVADMVRFQRLVLLVNFGAPTFKDGCKRIVNNHTDTQSSRLRLNQESHAKPRSREEEGGFQ